MALLLVFTLSLSAEESIQEDEDFKEGTVVKTVNGLKFNVPPDRPIEKKNSIVAPMEIDKYVALKFSKIESRLEKIENDIKGMKTELEAVRKDFKPLMDQKPVPQNPPLEQKAP